MIIKTITHIHENEANIIQNNYPPTVNLCLRSAVQQSSTKWKDPKKCTISVNKIFSMHQSKRKQRKIIQSITSKYGWKAKIDSNQKKYLRKPHSEGNQA